MDRYRNFSASPTRGPWATHFEEMAKNAVLKRLLKRLPKSSRAPAEDAGVRAGRHARGRGGLGGRRGAFAYPGLWTRPQGEILVEDEDTSER